MWLFSALCYLPLYLVQQGIAIPHSIVNVKYLFVAMPLLISLLMLLSEKISIRKWLKNLFSNRIKPGTWLLCTLTALCCIFCTYFFGEETLNIPSLALNLIYLLFMAALEELAWRGYLLNDMPKKKSKFTALLWVSLGWAMWHIPMWTVRNSIPATELPYWLIYTVSVGLILGIHMIRSENIIIPVIVHTIFNTALLTSVRVGIPAALFVFICTVFYYKAAAQPPQ